MAHSQRHWTVDGRQTDSKVQALIWANGDLSKIKFYFCDDQWRNEDYTQEPLESFEELAINRCNFLRNQCKTLALWLSSGYDSRTVLYYFIKSQNPIDEILVFERGNQTSFDQEYKVALETAKEYKKLHNPKCNIRFIKDVNAYLPKIYDSLKDNYLLGPGLSLRFTKSTLTWQVEYHDEVRGAIGESDSRIDVTGFEKPKVFCNDNKWYAFVPDTQFYDGGNTEKLTGFYTDVKDFKFYLKQHFMAVRFFESLHDFTPELVHEVQSNKKLYKEWNLAIGRIITDNWYSIDGKGKWFFKSSTESLDSKKYIKEFAGTSMLKTYLNGIEEIKRLCTWWDGKFDFDYKGCTISEPKFLKHLERPNGKF